MAIKRPEELDFSEKTFTLIISGSPGIGKTTLALSAPEPLLFDLDRGISRVRAEHRKLASEAETYEEMLEDMQSNAYRAAKSVVLDTGGSLIQLMQPWAKKQDAKAARDGRAMFGVVKREFDRLTAQMRQDRKNVIIIFHTTEVAKGDVITQRLSCEGSAKDIVWTPADLGCYMQMMGQKRVLGFTPTDEYFAKGCYGIGGMREVPSLKPGQPNDYLTRLFEEARQNIMAEMQEYAPQRKAYDAAMSEGRDVVAAIETVDDLNAAARQIGQMEHALTSKKELGAMLNAKAKELGATYSKEAKGYVPADVQPAK
jgi:nucleoside-triphosphatase THEP1/chaperonin cofactor prefoldin